MKKKIIISNLNKEKKILITIKIVTTANKKEIIIKRKVSIANNNFYMFKIFDVKNSTERTSAKFVINNTTSFLNIFKILSFDFKKFLK